MTFGQFVRSTVHNFRLFWSSSFAGGEAKSSTLTTTDEPAVPMHQEQRAGASPDGSTALPDTPVALPHDPDGVTDGVTDGVDVAVEVAAEQTLVLPAADRGTISDAVIESVDADSAHVPSIATSAESVIRTIDRAPTPSAVERLTVTETEPIRDDEFAPEPSAARDLSADDTPTDEAGGQIASEAVASGLSVIESTPDAAEIDAAEIEQEEIEQEETETCDDNTVDDNTGDASHQHGDDPHVDEPEIDELDTVGPSIVQGALPLTEEDFPPEIQVEVHGKVFNLTTLLEVLLFVADTPTEAAQFAKVLNLSPAKVTQGLGRLAGLYRTTHRGLRLLERDGHYQLVTMSEAAAVIEDFLNLDLTTRLSGPALEALAVIAYRQPVTRAQIEAVRGVDCAGVLRSLLQRELVEEVGRLETVGRPILYGVTDLFMQHFGLTGLNELPELKLEDADTLWAATELLESELHDGEATGEPDADLAVAELADAEVTGADDQPEAAFDFVESDVESDVASAAVNDAVSEIAPADSADDRAA